jgi:hypothetical protein
MRNGPELNGIDLGGVKISCKRAALAVVQCLIVHKASPLDLHLGALRGAFFVAFFFVPRRYAELLKLSGSLSKAGKRSAKVKWKLSKIKYTSWATAPAAPIKARPRRASRMRTLPPPQKKKTQKKTRLPGCSTA